MLRRWERNNIKRFPLFGSPLHDPARLEALIRHYRLDEIPATWLPLSVRTTGRLEQGCVGSLAEALMLYPARLRQEYRFGHKSVDELQEVAARALRNPAGLLAEWQTAECG